MLTIAVVDDEEKMIRTLVGYLHQYEEENGESFWIREYQNGFDLLKEKNRPDILLLDIEMPGIDGLKLAQSVRKQDTDCVIAFITNMAQYAINGYEVQARDFFVKPVNYKTFALKFRRLIDAAMQNEKKSIMVNIDYEKKRLNISDIYYIEVKQHRLYFHTTKGTLESWGSLSKIAEELRGYGFEFCNAYLLVNLKYVLHIGKGTIKVADDELTMSRGKTKTFLNALTEYEG